MWQYWHRSFVIVETYSKTAGVDEVGKIIEKNYYE